MAFVSNLGIAFQEITLRHADRTALIYPATGERVTYRELNQLADRIASVLRAKGLRRGQVAAMFHDKSPAAFAAMLACLRLGIVYTNLDPDSPWERLRKILGTCQPSMIISAFQAMPFGAELKAAGFRNTLHLRDMPASTGDEPLPYYRTIAGGSPAYAMFTSGSTGMPKGAVMSHANLLGFIAWARDRFAITPDDVLTKSIRSILITPFSIFTRQFSPAALAPIAADQVRDTRLLVRLSTPRAVPSGFLCHHCLFTC